MRAEGNNVSLLCQMPPPMPDTRMVTIRFGTIIAQNRMLLDTRMATIRLEAMINQTTLTQSIRTATIRSRTTNRLMMLGSGPCHVNFLESQNSTRQMCSRLRSTGAHRSPALLLEKWLSTE